MLALWYFWLSYKEYEEIHRDAMKQKFDEISQKLHEIFGAQYVAFLQNLDRLTSNQTNSNQEGSRRPPAPEGPAPGRSEQEPEIRKQPEVLSNNEQPVEEESPPEDPPPS